jgi:ABC-type hemin transport system substrate-binding protein
MHIIEIKDKVLVLVSGFDGQADYILPLDVNDILSIENSGIQSVLDLRKGNSIGFTTLWTKESVTSIKNKINEVIKNNSVVELDL